MSEKIQGKKPRSGRAKRGFTLLEVVIAAGILGIALVVIIRGYALALRGMERASAGSYAFMLAENLLAEYELDNDFSPGEDSGEFEDEAAGFLWKRSVSPLSYGGEVFEGVLRVEISVYREGDEGATLVTFIENL
jgi:type II secretion system protein I